jgi:hypothetical protein
VLEGLRPGATAWAVWERGAASLVPAGPPTRNEIDDVPDGGGQ